MPTLFATMPAGGWSDVMPLISTLGPTGILIIAFIFFWKQVVKPELDSRSVDQKATVEALGALNAAITKLSGLTDDTQGNAAAITKVIEVLNTGLSKLFEIQSSSQIHTGAMTQLINDQRVLVEEMRKLKECKAT